MRHADILMKFNICVHDIIVLSVHELIFKCFVHENCT